MEIEVHWWVKDVAEGICKIHSGIDIINNKNFQYIAEFMYSNYGVKQYTISDISKNDILDIFNYLSNKSSLFDFKCLENFQAKLNIGVICPYDWGIKDLKIKDWSGL